MTQETIKPQQPPPPQYSFEEYKISLLDILLVLAKHIKLIIVTPTIVCIFTIIYVLFIAEPVYVSQAKFMSSDTSDRDSNMMGLAAQFGFAVQAGNSQPNWSYEEIVKSRTMAINLLQHRFDTKKYGTQKELLQILTYGDETPEFSRDTLEVLAIAIFQDLVEINSNSKSGVYTLAFGSIEPKLSLQIVGIIINEIDKVLREYNAKQTTYTRQFIEERLIDTESDLEKAEVSLKIFRERNRNILESPNLQLEYGRLSRDVAVLMSVFTTLKQELEMAKIEEVKDSDYLIILDEPGTPISPDKPKKKFIVILAGIMGIGSGMMLAVIREYTQNSDDTEQQKISKFKSLLYHNMLGLFFIKDQGKNK